MALAKDDAVTSVTSPGIDLLLGSVVDGRFKVLELIGAGGMGRVYRAEQVQLKRPVALKVLDHRFGTGKDPSFRQRFLVEAALTAKLNHPNTVTVIDYGCTPEGLFWLAMEYLDGKTLEEVMTQQKGMPWRRALPIMEQVARAIAEAHGLGVVHRDLKPANVMLLGDGDAVKVLDFGLVKSFVVGQELEGRAITQQGMVVGSPVYMAPEQGEHNVADPRSDIYSLGVMLYEALQGQPPFFGPNPLVVMLDHVNKAVPPLHAPAGREPLPAALVSLVMKCLAKSPMDRFQSMEEVLAALRDVIKRAGARPTLPGEATQKLLPGHGAAKPGAARFSGRALTTVAFAVAVVVGSAITAVALRRRPAAAELTPAGATAVAPVPVTLHVASEPGGALVLMNGQKMGRTPLDVELPVGPDGQSSAEVTLTRSGYVPVTVRATGSGPRLEVSQTLRRVPPPIVAAPASSGSKSAKKKNEKASRPTRQAGHAPRR